MKRTHLFLAIIPASFILCLTLSPLAGQEAGKAPTPQPPGDLEKGMQIENRGPVHEAFAQPGAQTRGKGVTAPKAPPPLVPELPPDEKPSGANVTWIPGYWQWDTEKKDFLWVSGLWRNIPDGRSWEAGQWRENNGAWEYIPGFWKQVNQPLGRNDLPEPPESVENGPNTPAPHDDAFWRPGRWEYRGSRYLWVPGYWAEPEGDLIWQPGQYCYSGYGYRYVPGYWDYCLEDRGLLFAPVYFTSALWNQPGWCYRPSFAINVGFGGGWGWGWGGFYSSLFIGPRCNSFYFGNYFSPWYWGGGYRPWCWSGRGYYNSCFNHYTWLNRNNAGWAKGVRQTYVARSFGAVGQPARGAITGGVARGGAGLVNSNSAANLSRVASRFGGEAAGKNLDERVFRGQTIRQVDQAVKQTGSLNVVQPASEVRRAQELARSLPARNSETVKSRVSSGSVQNSLSSARRSSAALSEQSLRQRMSDTARSTPLIRSEAAGRDLPTAGNRNRSAPESPSNTLRSLRFEQPRQRSEASEFSSRIQRGGDAPVFRGDSTIPRSGNLGSPDTSRVMPRGLDTDRVMPRNLDSNSVMPRGSFDSSRMRGSLESSRMPRDFSSTRMPMSQPSFRSASPSMGGASMGRGAPSGGGFRGGAMPSGGGRAGGGGSRGGKR